MFLRTRIHKSMWIMLSVYLTLDNLSEKGYLKLHAVLDRTPQFIESTRLISVYFYSTRKFVNIVKTAVSSVITCMKRSMFS